MLKEKLILFAILHFVFSFDRADIACPPHIDLQTSLVQFIVPGIAMHLQIVASRIR